MKHFNLSKRKMLSELLKQGKTYREIKEMIYLSINITKSPKNTKPKSKKIKKKYFEIEEIQKFKKADLLEILNSFVKLINNLDKNWEKLNFAQKKDFLRICVVKLIVSPRELRLKLDKMASAMLNLPEILKWLPGLDSN